MNNYYNLNLEWLFNKKYWWVYHILFWVFMYLDESLSLIGVTDEIDNYPHTISILVLDMVIIYFNIYFLLPQFLLKNKWKTYVGWSILTLIINAFLSMNAWDYLPPADWYKDYLEECENCASLIQIFLTEFIITFVSTATILATAVGIKFFKHFVKDQQRLREMETLSVKSELAFLKSQINPHFLFNALNGIYVQTRKRPEEASESVLLLSDLLRYQLYDCAKEKVYLKDEIDYLKNYLNIDKLRRSKAKVNFTVSGNPNGRLVSPMLFIPFIENAVKHGVNLDNESTIDIHFGIKDQEIVFNVENSKPLKLLEGIKGGIGLNNVKRRLELLYPGKHQLDILDDGLAFKIKLKLST